MYLGTLLGPEGCCSNCTILVGRFSMSCDPHVFVACPETCMGHKTRAGSRQAACLEALLVYNHPPRGVIRFLVASTHGVCQRYRNCLSYALPLKSVLRYDMSTS